MTDYIETFRCLGMELAEAPSNQYRGNCPFCEKEGHLYIRSGESNGKSVDGMWKCQYCNEKGNVYTFLNRLHDISKDITTKADYSELWNKKSIPPAAARICGVVKSALDSKWLIPTVNDKGRVINFHRWEEEDYDDQGDMKGKLMGTTGLEIKLLGLQFLSEEKRPLLVFEGHWDWIVAEHCFRATKQRNDIDILGVAGTSSFKEEWLIHLSSRPEVLLVFDNDHPRVVGKKTKRTIQPGLDGMKRIAKMVSSMENPPNQLSFIKWPDGLANGFDVRDLYRQERTNV